MEGNHIRSASYEQLTPLRGLITLLEINPERMSRTTRRTENARTLRLLPSTSCLIVAMDSFIKVSLSAYCVPVPVFWESQPWGHSHVNLSSQHTALIMCRWVERGPGEAPQRRPSGRVRTDVPGAGPDSPERSRPALSLHLPDTHPSEVTCAPAARCGEPGRLRPNPKWKAG